MFGSNVQPRRVVREKPKPWKCCGRMLAGYLARCPSCSRRRLDNSTTSKRAVAGEP